MADAFTFSLPLTDKELALALKNHVDVAGRRFGVGLNQSFELKKINMLVGVDLGIIAMYSEAVANYYVAVEKCEEQGMVIETQQGPKVNPWFTTKQNCVKQAMQLGQLIGVTPSARARIPNTNQKPVSKLELLKSKSA